MLDTFRQLGTPIKVERVGEGYKYRFAKLEATFGGKEDARVNTIIINKDYQDINHNGLKLGDKVEYDARKILVKKKRIHA